MSGLPDAGLENPPQNPFDLFERWYADARTHERHERTAMTLATADVTGHCPVVPTSLACSLAGAFQAAQTVSSAAPLMAPLPWLQTVSAVA